MQVKGAEFGTTTGRKRDCGWLDLVALRYAVKINGATEIALTKLDVLAGMKVVKMATAYRLPNGEEMPSFPEDTSILADVEPVYREFLGWAEGNGGTKWEDLPVAARNYVMEIEKHAGVPVKLVSIGAERSNTIVR